MEWTLPETASFGVVALATIFLLYRSITQGADPRIVGVLNQMATLIKQLSDTNDKSEERWGDLVKNLTDALNKNSAVIETMRTGFENWFTGMSNRIQVGEDNAVAQSTGIIEALQGFRGVVEADHALAIAKIEGLPQIISPTIEELATRHIAAEQSRKGMQTIMEGISRSQDATNGELTEILAALRRIESSLSEWKADSAAKIEKIEADVNAVKDDLRRHIPNPAEPKPEAETKDDTDV